jgi:hypothetical protein
MQYLTDNESSNISSRLKRNNIPGSPIAAAGRSSPYPNISRPRARDREKCATRGSGSSNAPEVSSPSDIPSAQSLSKTIGGRQSSIGAPCSTGVAFRP